jgi:ribulose-phosphate 3-epimerase
LLAVTPGPSGQAFDERIIKKIEVLSEKMPNVLIEVDGGINKDIAIRVRDAGADIIVAASYVFGSDDPGDTFRELKSI